MRSVSVPALPFEPMGDGLMQVRLSTGIIKGILSHFIEIDRRKRVT